MEHKEQSWDDPEPYQRSLTVGQFKKKRMREGKYSGKPASLTATASRFESADIGPHFASLPDGIKQKIMDHIVELSIRQMVQKNFDKLPNFQLHTS